MKRVLQKGIAAMVIAFGLLIVSAETAFAVDYTVLFDAAYYAKNNPDVVETYGSDAKALYKHYINCGINEGRNAGPLFDVKQYRKNNSDLEKLYGDNWAAYVNQYLTSGLKNGRVGYGEEFDAASYANRYSDLKNVYGYNLKALYTHYLTRGKREGRDASCASTNTVNNEEKKEEPQKITLQNGRQVQRKAKQLFTILNEERVAWGLTKFTWDSSLAALAEERAAELTVKFEHIRPNGRTVYEYNNVEEENIASWYYDPEDVHNAFMSVRRDAFNIIDPDLKKVGIAYYEVGGIGYWCELFKS